MAINAFLVLGVTPAHNEQQVPVNTVINISFAKHMDINTLHEGTIILRKVNGEVVKYTSSYNRETYKMTVTPSQLLPNTQYQLEVIGGTTGVKTVVGDYMPQSRTYEFTTIQNKAVSKPRNILLKQQEKYIVVSWDIPEETNENEAIFYDVKVSSSNDPENQGLWPVSNEGTTTQTNLSIPKEFEYEQSYYVFLRARAGEFKSDWVIAQIYMEKPKVTDPGNGGGTGPDPFAQIEIIETYPSHILKENQVLLVFSDEVDETSVNEKSLYLVQAPYKPQLSLIDLLTAYSKDKAVKATVGLLADNKQVLEWKTDEKLPLEKEYTLVVDKELKGKNVNKIGHYVTKKFRTPWVRLYGSYETIKDILGSVGAAFSEDYIYDQMRVNSLYAYDIISTKSGFDEKAEIPYYVDQYVNLQTAYDILLNAISRSSGAKKDSVKLGQLQVAKEFDIEQVMRLLDKLKKDMKQWMDLMQGQHNRGYAKPKSVVRGEVGAPYPDALNHTELKSFD